MTLTTEKKFVSDKNSRFVITFIYVTKITNYNINEKLNESSHVFTFVKHSHGDIAENPDVLTMFYCL